VPSKTKSSAKTKPAAPKAAKSRATASRAKSSKPRTGKSPAAKSSTSKTRKTTTRKSPARKAPARNAKAPKAEAKKTSRVKVTSKARVARGTKNKAKPKVKPAPAEGVVILHHQPSGTVEESRPTAPPASANANVPPADTENVLPAGNREEEATPRPKDSPRPAAAQPISVAKTGGVAEDNGGGEIRTNKLVPTNAVHPTERRLKRGMGPARAMMALGGFVVIGLAILSTQQPEPPALTPLERQAASAPAFPVGSTFQSEGPHGATYPVVTLSPNSDALREMISPLEMTVLEDARTVVAIETPPETAALSNSELLAEAETPIEMSLIEDEFSPAENEESLRTVFGGTPPWSAPGSGTQTAGLSSDELAEMERMLAQLDLGPSPADGVVDNQTQTAIRLYQEIAGLPVDGEPSAELLTDMREVVRILESTD
jgi:hypothetical protein